MRYTQDLLFKCFKKETILFLTFLTYWGAFSRECFFVIQLLSFISLTTISTLGTNCIYRLIVQFLKKKKTSKNLTSEKTHLNALGNFNMAKHDRGPLRKLSFTIVSKFKQKKVLYVNVINWNVNLEVVYQGYLLKIKLTSIRSIDETPTDYTVIFIPGILKHIKSKLNTKVLKMIYKQTAQRERWSECRMAHGQK